MNALIKLEISLHKKHRHISIDLVCALETIECICWLDININENKSCCIRIGHDGM